MGCVLSTQPDQQKRPQSKNAQKLSNIEKIFHARFAHSAFYKIHISGAANRHAPVQYAKYVVFFFFFFEAVIMIRTLYFILYQFRQKYNYIMANINSESSRVIFSFFCLHPVGQTFLYPSKVCNHLKHSAK